MIPETGKVSGNGGKVMTFRGWVDPPELAITDAHNQIWIEAIPGVPPGAPRLDDQKLIQQELLDYRQAGGGSIVVCHPGGCGRCDYFIAEFVEGVTEAAKPNAAKAGERAEKVRAGQIKIACEAQLEDTPPALMEAAAEASRRAGATIAIHTEKGSQAERILDNFRRQRVEPRRLVLCNVDKRPDAGLHSEPIQAGAMLEYDTFFRPKYEPEKYVRPLVEQPTRDGLASGIALATDMAETKLWSRLGEGPGPTGFVILIRSRLRRLGIAQDTIDRLTGGNIANCLARQPD